MFGRQVKLPVDLMYGTTQGKETACSNGVREEFERSMAFWRHTLLLETDAKQSINGRRASMTERFTENHIVKAILFGCILQLYHLDNPGSCTGPGKDPIKWWKGSETPPTSCMQGTRGRRPQIVHFDRLKPCPPNVRLANEPRPERPAADEVVLPTLNQGSNASSDAAVSYYRSGHVHG